MKKTLLFILTFCCFLACQAQLGIGTTSPNSTLDVRGSVAFNYRSFSTTTSTSATDHTLNFTGSSAATVTLLTAVGCTGRMYVIKNASATIPTPLLTIATTASQTINSNSSIQLDEQGKTITIISNGTNWEIVAKAGSNNTSTPWDQNGNSVSSLKSIGTTSNFDLPFITNNTEVMRLTNTGSLGIGTSTFDGTNPEKLLVDAGNTSSFNVISGKGTTDNYLQLNIQNKSTGANASSDLVATANNGTETTNFVDLGINSSGYSSSGILGGANNAYLYATGNDFVIGNATANKDVIIFAGGIANSNERMRITPNGYVALGSLGVSFRRGSGNYTILATDYVVIHTGGASTWTLPDPTTCSGRVYRLLNHGSGTLTLSRNVRTASGTTTTSLATTAAANFFEILSDGVEWRRIN